MELFRICSDRTNTHPISKHGFVYARTQGRWFCRWVAAIIKWFRHDCIRASWIEGVIGWWNILYAGCLASPNETMFFVTPSSDLQTFQLFLFLVGNGCSPHWYPANGCYHSNFGAMITRLLSNDVLSWNLSSEQLTPEWECGFITACTKGVWSTWMVAGK